MLLLSITVIVISTDHACRQISGRSWIYITVILDWRHGLMALTNRLPFWVAQSTALQPVHGLAPLGPQASPLHHSRLRGSLAARDPRMTPASTTGTSRNERGQFWMSIDTSAPNTILCASSHRHSFNRRCNVRSCPSGKMPGSCSCSRSSNSRDVRHGSASNHSRICTVTSMNGSGRRRPRGAFGVGLLVGRTSPPCHAVRSPERNWSSVEGLGAAASPATGRSAIATSSPEFPGSFAAIEPGPAWRAYRLT